MVLESNGRMGLQCNSCPVRLDLGPTAIVRTRNRTPSGWVNAGNDVHYCPMCAPAVSIDSLYPPNDLAWSQPLA